MFTKHTNKYLSKTTGTILSFVLIYSTTGILLAKQITSFRHTNTTQVKNEEVSLPQVGHITNDNTIEPLAATNDKPSISTYTVAPGDTLASVAKKFDISVNTILWANNLSSKAALKVGQKLVILPVTGITYTVKKGDTLGSIAKKLKADQSEIISFNDLGDAKYIKVGMKLVIPDVEPQVPTKVPEKKVAEKTQPKKTEAKKVETPAVITTPTTTTPPPTTATPALDAPEVSVPSTTPLKSTTDYFVMPIPGSHISQGLHGYNSVDFGAPTGTPVLAAAEGIVIVAKNDNGFGGGYGNYIVISHPNSTQTLYAHLSKVEVGVEDTVKQGQEIGKCGRTGRATGPHLHFEVRGGVNPWVGTKVGTSL